MRGMERPPRWGLVALVILFLGNAALLTYLFALRPAPVDPHAGSPTPATSSPSAEATADPSAEGATGPTLVLAVYGDDYSAGSDMGGEGPRGWPALVSERLALDLRLVAPAGAGYVSAGITGQAFPQVVTANPVPDADAVIVFGSRNDEGSDTVAVERAAAATMVTLRSSSPEALFVVIGPAWSNGDPPASLDDLSRAVQRAATAVGATYVDPLEEGWFAEPASLIASDGISPTNAGHAYLADLITPLLETALVPGAQPAG